MVHDAAAQLLGNSAQLPPEGEPIKCGLSAVTNALSVKGRVLAGAASTMLSRPLLQTSLVRSGFRVHFDTTGFNTPTLLDGTGAAVPGTARAYVDSVFASLAYVAPIETQVLGYGVLPSDDTLNGGPEYDVFIMELGSMYGYTTPDGSPPDGGTATTFMTIDNDYAFVHPAVNRGLPALHVTIAHELHHALQIGNYGYWQNDVFFYEITSTWMEDVLYPEVNDYYEYLKASWGHFRTPERAFTSNDLICYSRSIWGHYIAARYGRDMMRTTWEQIRAMAPMAAIDRALRTKGYDAQGAFADWSLWNHFTGTRSEPSKYYPDAADYPLMMEIPVEYRPPSREITGSLAPFAARYYQLMRSPDTMTVIVANVDLAAATAQAAGKDYAFDFRSTRPNDGYRITPIGLFAHLGVATPVHWASWFVVGDTVRRNIDASQFAEGRAFPNPFLPGNHARAAMPVDGTDQVTGSVSVFSSGLDPVYTSGTSSSSWYLDRQMFFWDGKGTDGSAVPSGIYIYVIDLGDRRVTGKIALVRR
ncbi:MAG: hypothetical protein IPI01_03080 [Ignavibacteriae bacterium]|nr:hypothetical protein [Ignavibacteriota bacterium]